jgi:integrase
MMDIILQTSLRQQDVRALRWDDIEGDTLYVRVLKSLTLKRTDQQASYLKFSLGENEQLRKAINRARELRMETQGKREAYRDCPFIVFVSDLRRHELGDRDHVLEVSKRYGNLRLKAVRAKVIEETDLFSGYSDGQLPAFHGMRKLSLQCLEDQGKDDDFLMTRGAHKSFITTRDDYLGRGDPRWVDSTASVHLGSWMPGEHARTERAVAAEKARKAVAAASEKNV